MATEAKIAGEAARAAGAGILAARADAAGEQVELFGLPVADESGEIAAATGRVARGPGRPEGASNKATVALRDHLLRKGVLPQAALMQWVMLGPAGLAKALVEESLALERARFAEMSEEQREKAIAEFIEPAFPPEFMLGCFKEWAKVAGDLGKYFMAPMSPQDAQGKSVPMFNVILGGGLGQVDKAGNQLPPWAYIDVEQNQPVAPSDGGESQSKESKE